MKTLATLRTAVAIAMISLTAAIATAQNAIEVGNVRRPPEAFLEHGDVIGLSPALLSRLGIKEGDPVQITTPAGKVAAFGTKIHGDRTDAIYAKKSLRDAMGIEDGAIRLKVESVTWGPGPAQATELKFNNVVRPPVDFLDYGDAVGVSLSALKSVNGHPGMVARLTGPRGTRTVTVQLLDRGEGAIAMKKTLRDAIGAAEGTTQVTLAFAAAPAGSTPAAAPPLAELHWFQTIDGAITAAREEFRPVLVYAHGGDTAAARVDALLKERAVHESLLRTRKYRFNPAQDTANATFFRADGQPLIVILTPSGQELARLHGNISAEQIIAAANSAVAQVRRPAGMEDAE